LESVKDPPAVEFMTAVVSDDALIAASASRPPADSNCFTIASCFADSASNSSCFNRNACVMMRLLSPVELNFALISLGTTNVNDGPLG
jgi:hypothetical protein